MHETNPVNHIYLRRISNETASAIIVKNHYSHRWTICELALGVYSKDIQESFFETDSLVGAIVFGPAAGGNVAKSLSPLLNHENLWELKRLWIDDRLGKNAESKVIALAISHIKQHRKDIKCLVSYADPDAGHRGIIYQATNWIYQDIERPKNSSGHVFSFNKGRTWVHPRTIFNKYGTFDVDRLIAVMPRPFWVKELAVKHRYVYPLGDRVWRKKLIASFNYSDTAYPKNNRNEERVRKYES